MWKDKKYNRCLRTDAGFKMFDLKAYLSTLPLVRYTYTLDLLNVRKVCTIPYNIMLSYGSPKCHQTCHSYFMIIITITIFIIYYTVHRYYYGYYFITILSINIYDNNKVNEINSINLIYKYYK